MTTIEIVLVLAVVAGVAYLATKDKKKKDEFVTMEDDIVHIPEQPESFDEAAYLEANPDVAAANMEAWVHYHLFGKEEGRPLKPKPRITFKTARIVYGDDGPFEKGGRIHGDPNGAQDLPLVLAVCMAHGELPMAVASTATTGGTSTQPFKDTLRSQPGFEHIPVLKGANTYSFTDKNEYTDFLVRESRKGPLTICSGGPANDIANAVRRGANVGNLTLRTLLFDTWNEHGSDGMQESDRKDMQQSADIVRRSGMKIHNIPESEFKTWNYDEKFRAAGKNPLDHDRWTRLFLGHLKGQEKKYTAPWAEANTRLILDRIAELNVFMNVKTGAYHRVADFLTVLDHYGVPWRTNPQAAYDVVEKGFKLMRELNTE